MCAVSSDPYNSGYGYALGLSMPLVTAAVAGFALIIADTPTWLVVSVGAIVGIVPYFLGRMSKVKGWIDAIAALIMSRRPQHG